MKIKQIIQNLIYKNNIKHYIEPFATNLDVAKNIYCDNKVAVFKNKKQCAGDVLIANCHYYEIIPPKAQCLIYCQPTKLTDYELLDFMQWVYIMASKGHIVIVKTSTTTNIFGDGQLLIKNKKTKITIYGGVNNA